RRQRRSVAEFVHNHTESVRGWTIPGYRVGDLTHSRKAHPCPAASSAPPRPAHSCSASPPAATRPTSPSPRPRPASTSPARATTAQGTDSPPPDPADFVGMDEHTPEGAEQAFRYYIAVLYWSYQTGSQKELEALQGSTCSECNKLLKEISDIRANGAHWTNVEISTKGSTSAESENYDIEIGYIYTVSEHEERSAATNEVRTIPQDAWTARGGMYWTDDGWIVGGIDISETDREL